MNVVSEILTFYKEIGADFVEKHEGNTPYDINDIRAEIMQCTQCHLHETKQNYVPGEGCMNPDILFVGEGPGETEDNFGKPFIGKAGQLLDKLIARMGYSRETVFIANIVKCRPPNNRDPKPGEVEACKPFMVRQIEILKPKVIVCLGRVAMNNLLNASHSITRVRGTQFEFMGTPVIPTYHPSYILRQRAKESISKVKWETWHDMEKVLALVKEAKADS
ncbi:MAG: uracil-DNA glycosylase [bacterium]|nr:uracil-DNA glycosylase [bacterium]